jgi:transposase
MVSKPLYLFPQFFEDKSVEHLLGKGIEPSHLNDDKIGRVMDKLFKFGLSPLFLLITLEAIKKYQINTEYSHLDSSSFSLHGEYLFKENRGDSSELEGNNQVPIRITHGYSRDHRPDLKQFIIDLIVSGDGDIPIYLRVADGNENDKGVFGEIACEYKTQVNFETMVIGDSALYTQKNLKLMEEMEWLSRVPLSIKEAKKLVSELSSSDLNSSDIEGYSHREVESNYGGIPQRWLVVESEKRKESDLEKLNKKIHQEKEKAQQKLTQLIKTKFESSSGATEIVNQYKKKLKYHRLTNLKVTEVESSSPQKSSKKQQSQPERSYQITANLELDAQKVESLKRRAGRFILATNRLNREQFSSSEILRKYKEQQAAERGFAFLKDPLFFADSVFLKSPQRIETMGMLMGLCLLVYSLGQRQLRVSLKQAKERLTNQLGKLTECPTLRWIFQGFTGVHLVTIQGIQQVVNLTEQRRKTLCFLPTACHKYYFLSG